MDRDVDYNWRAVQPRLRREQRRPVRGVRLDWPAELSSQDGPWTYSGLPSGGWTQDLRMWVRAAPPSALSTMGSAARILRDLPSRQEPGVLAGLVVTVVVLAASGPRPGRKHLALR